MRLYMYIKQRQILHDHVIRVLLLFTKVSQAILNYNFVKGIIFYEVNENDCKKLQRRQII